MYHSRLFSPRPHRALCVFLAVSGAGLWLLPSRGRAQEGTVRPAAAPGNPADGTGDSSANGDYQNGTMTGDGGTSATDSAAPDTGNTDTGVNGTGATNGNESANSPTDPSSNPAVGVDTLGHTDAVATRNGRTTRRRRVPPVNPLVLTNPLRGNGPGAFDGSHPTPLVPMREPGDYTLQTDPFQMSRRPLAKPLPLFGYDFFQPARQIITARRRALLPPRPVRRPVQTNTRNRGNRTGTGQNNSYPLDANLNGGQNGGVGNASTNSGYGAADAAALAVVQRRGASLDQNTAGQNGLDQSVPDQNGTDTSGYSDTTGQTNTDQTGRETRPSNGTDNPGQRHGWEHL
jgi:hypothetical protein